MTSFCGFVLVGGRCEWMPQYSCWAMDWRCSVEEWMEGVHEF